MSYTQQHQCTLASRSVLLEDTRSQALLSQKTPRAGSPPEKSSSSQSLCDTSSMGRTGRWQGQLLSPPHAHPWGKASEHQSCCFSEGRVENQIGSVHRVDSAGAGSSFHQKLQKAQKEGLRNLSWECRALTAFNLSYENAWHQDLSFPLYPNGSSNDHSPAPNTNILNWHSAETPAWTWLQVSFSTDMQYISKKHLRNHTPSSSWNFSSE